MLDRLVRHSEGTRAWVSVVSRDGHVVATVRDDGKGLANGIAELHPGKIGVGISGMRLRVKELGGEFRLQNANPGVLVEVIVPVEQGVALKKPCPLPPDSAGFAASPKR
jgi:two-component system, NarL family, sensor kinase